MLPSAGHPWAEPSGPVASSPDPRFRAITRCQTGNFAHCNKDRDGPNGTSRLLQGTAAEIKRGVACSCGPQTMPRLPRGASQVLPHLNQDHTTELPLDTRVEMSNTKWVPSRNPWLEPFGPWLKHVASFPQLSNFSYILLNFGKFLGEANDEKHADPGKKNRKSETVGNTVGTCQKHFYDPEKKRICTGIVIWIMPEGDSIECSRYFIKTPRDRQCRTGAIMKFDDCSTCRLFEIINNFSVRMLSMISNNQHFPNILPNLRQHSLQQETPALSSENVRISVNMFTIMLVDSNSWY